MATNMCKLVGCLKYLSKNKIKIENKNKNNVSVKIIKESIIITKYRSDNIHSTRNPPVTTDSTIKALITQVKLSMRICAATTAILLSPNNV